MISPLPKLCRAIASIEITRTNGKRYTHKADPSLNLLCGALGDEGADRSAMGMLRRVKVTEPSEGGKLSRLSSRLTFPQM